MYLQEPSFYTYPAVSGQYASETKRRPGLDVPADETLLAKPPFRAPKLPHHLLSAGRYIAQRRPAAKPELEKPVSS